MLLDENYAEIRNMAKKFADQEVAPIAAQIDRNHQIPKELIEKIAANGFLGVFIPEEYGGSGMDYMAYAIIIEEVSRVCASTSVFISAHNSLGIYPLLTFGTEEQKKKYLPKLASGEMIACYCLTEPNAGSDAGSLTSFAEDKGDHFEITGSKMWITNGREADLAIVFAKTKKTPDYKGISCFIVETKTPGFKVVKLEEKLGINGSSTAQIAFDKVKVPVANLLGEREKGFRVAMNTLDGGRIGIAAQALGIAQGAFDYAKQYTSQRVQFGKALNENQAIQFALADMSTKLAASRLLIYDATHRKMRGLDHGKNAAQAKLFSSEACMWITHKAVQLLGGNGFSREYPVERYFRDAKITEIYEGTSEIQRIVIAAKELKG